MLERVEHSLRPFIFKEAKILILGTMPSPKSREVGFYYGHPQNRFWKVLATVLNQDIPSSIDEKQEFLLKNRIALWDVLASCEIDGASDATIKNIKMNDILSAKSGTDIVQIFTTGKTAYKLLVKGGMESVCLPSTSPANCSMKIEELVAVYKENILKYL